MGVFVTGANGRLGLALVSALATRGIEVMGLARTQEKAQAVRRAGARDCLVGDIYDLDVLVRGLAGVDRVFHLAGGLRGPGKESADRLNRHGTACLVQAIRRQGGRPRVIFTSSVAVYGDRAGLWLDETYAPSPNTLYGRSKADAEGILLELGKEDGLDVRVARLAQVYGPGHPSLMEKALKRGSAWLPGEGENLVPVVHVDDAVGLVLAVDERGSAGIWNVAEPDQPTLGAFLNEVARALGTRPPRFWSTYLPSYVQLTLAGFLERGLNHTRLTPPVTPDLLRLFTASSRMKVDRAAQELGYVWRHPDYRGGIAASVSR